jgi:hypothetical protein
MDGARHTRGRVIPLRRSGGMADVETHTGVVVEDTVVPGSEGETGRACCTLVEDGHGASAVAAAVPEDVRRLDRRVLLTGRDMRGISIPRAVLGTVLATYPKLGYRKLQLSISCRPASQQMHSKNAGECGANERK